MSRVSGIPKALVFIWAGLLVGGSLIAAPAKFQVASLSLTTALEIGQVTFRWVGIAEAVLAFTLILSVLILKSRSAWPVVIPIGLLALQRLAIFPALDARTVAIINGGNVGESNLHIVFVVLEIFKILALIWTGFHLTLRQNAGNR